jgi:hypothetical protein
VANYVQTLDGKGPILGEVVQPTESCDKCIELWREYANAISEYISLLKEQERAYGYALLRAPDHRVEIALAKRLTVRDAIKTDGPYRGQLELGGGLLKQLWTCGTVTDSDLNSRGSIGLNGCFSCVRVGVEIMVDGYGIPDGGQQITSDQGARFVLKFARMTGSAPVENPVAATVV